MRKLCLAVCAGLAAGVALAGPLPLEQVAGDAQWVVHADLDLLKNTEIGKWLLGQLNGDEAARKLAAFQAVFNFDPRKDVGSVTLYGRDAREENGVALVRGAFDAQRLLTLARAGDGYQELAHGKHAVHAWRDKQSGKRHYAAMHSAGAVVFSSEAGLQQALDVLDGKKPSMAGGGLFRGFEAIRNAAFLAGAASLSGMGELSPEAAMLKQASAGVMALSETAGEFGAAVVLTAKDADAAAQIEAVARGIVALAALNQEKEPGGAALARASAIAAEGSTVRWTLRIPAARIIAFIEERRAAGAAAKAGADGE